MVARDDAYMMTTLGVGGVLSTIPAVDVLVVRTLNCLQVEDDFYG